jgi:hypothetical protein
MPKESKHDPRTRLVREKYFSLRPKPLERWLWQQELPQAAERVFWLHWEEGMKSGDWCSQLPLKRVASLCCVDASTVTRAYQLLKSLNLIRRQDPGRDPGNPFQQATAITEVRLPRSLLTQLAGSPNRLQINVLQSTGASASAPPELAPEAITESVAPPTRSEVQATWNRVSSAERARYFHASRNGMANMEFDPDTDLSEEDRSQLLRQLEQMARARNSGSADCKSVQRASIDVGGGSGMRRRLTTLMLARTRHKLLQLVAAPSATELWRQIVWSVEEGALRRFEPSLALNIAVKKVREGIWTRPNRMPPNWARLATRAETCVYA